MNKYWKEEWLDALRSGEYDQTEGTLENSDGANCCLGVLLDIMDTPWCYPYSEGNRFYFDTEEAMEQYTKEMDDPSVEGYTYCPGTDTELSTNIRHKVGITPEQQCTLIKLNDDEEATFKEIADYIDAEL